MTKPTTLVEDKFTLSPAVAEARNEALLRVAMEMLYATYVVDKDASEARGLAVQAVNNLSLKLGGPDLTSEWERR